MSFFPSFFCPLNPPPPMSFPLSVTFSFSTGQWKITPLLILACASTEAKFSWNQSVYFRNIPSRTYCPSNFKASLHDNNSNTQSLLLSYVRLYVDESEVANGEGRKKEKIMLGLERLREKGVSERESGVKK